MFQNQYNTLLYLSSPRKAVYEAISSVVGEVGGDGVFRGKGSPGATKRTLFSFLGSQTAGYKGSRNSVWYLWMSVMVSPTP